MTSNVSGSMTVTSSDSSFGTYTRSGTSATRGSSSPLTVPAYTPPIASGVGVGSTVGEGCADAMALGARLGLDAPMGVTEGVVVAVEQAARSAPATSTLAHRRLNACCRCDPG